MSFSTPIAFCIFNRPEKTQCVFDAIARQRPQRLLVIGDGPRDDHPEDQSLVEQTRGIIECVNGPNGWDCELETNFSATNLGCRRRMASGLDWAFDRCERLIVLEDDCLPDERFFDFTQQMLDRYADQPEVMMISGDNFQPQRRTEYSYYFSRWTHIWGWASWRRAWQHYDLELTQWPQVKTTDRWRQWSDDPQQDAHWSGIFDAVHRGEVDTWDFSWMFACWIQGGLTVIPECNLVSNIGFDAAATHTLDSGSWLANRACGSLEKLLHPPIIEAHHAADQWTWENVFRPTPETKTSQPKKRFFTRRILQSLGLSYTPHGRN